MLSAGAGTAWAASRAETDRYVFCGEVGKLMCPLVADPTDALQSTELVWDTSRVATARSEAFLLPQAPGMDWTPALLLATAAGASLLATFAEIADDAEVPILGYVAHQRADIAATTNEISGITLSVCVSVPSAAAAAAARAAWKLAINRAPVLRVVACPLHCEPSIVVVNDGDRFSHDVRTRPRPLGNPPQAAENSAPAPSRLDRPAG
jgi:OsmC-like protein